MSACTRHRVGMSPDPASTTNPYLSRLVQGLEMRGYDVVPLRRDTLLSVEVIHFQWPDLIVSQPNLLASVRGIASCLLAAVQARLRHRPVIWTVHNLRPHRSARPRLEAAFWWAFTRLVTGWISLSEAGRTQILAAYPALRRKPGAVIAHGSYGSDYPVGPPTAELARRAHGLDAVRPYLLFFGQLRRYKNVPELVAAHARTTRADLDLCVVGEAVEPELAGVLARATADDHRIRVFVGRVPDGEVAAWFTGAVGTVLPFAAGLNSGSVFLSLSMGRPVLVPRTATFAEIAGRVGPGWIHLYDGPLTADLLERFAADSSRLLAEDDGTGPDLSAYSWDTMCRETDAFYRSLLVRPGRPGAT